MARRVLLVGHCGSDSSRLMAAVRSADGEARITSATDDADLRAALKQGVDLVLLNRQLGWGFEQTEGLELVRHLRRAHPAVRTMLISDYAEVQAAAVKAGAVRGFGKRELGTPRVVEVVREALS